MVVLDLHVDDVHWLIEVATASQEIYDVADKKGETLDTLRRVMLLLLGHTVANSVKASLLACYYDVGDGLAFLPSLRRKLDPAVSV